MFETGVLLLFLAPGLAAYVALYGIFHDGKAIAPEPPGANTIEAVAIIAGVSLGIHAVSASLFSMNVLFCDASCPIEVPVAWLDPYRSATKAVAGDGIGGFGITLALLGVVGQSVVAYFAVRLWLRRLAQRDRLPAWIYGWATSLANALDNPETAVLAYVLTTTECGDRTLAYGGLVHDLSLKPDGCITRIALMDCERYLVNLRSTIDDASLSDALSRFSFVTIDASNIRNIAFETITLDEIA